MSFPSISVQFLNELIIMLTTYKQEVKFPLCFFEETKKLQHTSVLVRVPNSEIVAQIVGKQGSKIKTLREKTNTFIKIPYREDEPVFSIYGCIHGVMFAKSAIVCASYYFFNLTTTRSHICLPGEVTIKVNVPEQFAGFVIGRRGNFIIKIKKQSQTRISTPKPGTKYCNFKVTGYQMNVLAALKAIEEKLKQVDNTVYSKLVHDSYLKKHDS